MALVNSFRVDPSGFNKVTVVSANTNNLDFNRGFMVDVDGTASLRFRGDAAVQAIPVLAGLIYPGDVAQFDLTGSTGPTKVYLLQSVTPD